MDNNDISRMRVLAGLLEAEIIRPEDADDMRLADMDAQMAREARIEALIVRAFVACGLPVEYDIVRGKKVWKGVAYTEDDRSARVALDDFEVDLGALVKLHGSGLSASYTVSASGNGIDVTFTVNPELDRAVEG